MIHGAYLVPMLIRCEYYMALHRFFSSFSDPQLQLASMLSQDRLSCRARVSLARQLGVRLPKFTRLWGCSISSFATKTYLESGLLCLVVCGSEGAFTSMKIKREANFCLFESRRMRLVYFASLARNLIKISEVQDYPLPKSWLSLRGLPVILAMLSRDNVNPRCNYDLGKLCH